MSVDDRGQDSLVSAIRPALGRDIAVVEGEERDTELDQELERGVELHPRGHRVARRPASFHGRSNVPDAEHVRARPGERVPQADGDPEVVLHPLAQDQPIRLVHLVRQRVAGSEARERDRSGHVAEERLAHPAPSLTRIARMVGMATRDGPSRHPSSPGSRASVPGPYLPRCARWDVVVDAASRPWRAPGTGRATLRA